MLILKYYINNFCKITIIWFNMQVFVRLILTSSGNWPCWHKLSLMLLAEQVVDSLDWIKRVNRHFNEHGVPVTHGPIPQSW